MKNVLLLLTGCFYLLKLCASSPGYRASFWSHELRLHEGRCSTGWSMPYPGLSVKPMALDDFAVMFY